MVDSRRFKVGCIQRTALESKTPYEFYLYTGVGLRPLPGNISVRLYKAGAS